MKTKEHFSVISETLSDGSKVFAVVVNTLRFDCISEDHAIDVVGALLEALHNKIIE